MLFEQSQDIVSRIQQILREYPYGNAVLLELLQNADDAGASTCHIQLVAQQPTVPRTLRSILSSNATLSSVMGEGCEDHNTKGKPELEHYLSKITNCPALLFFNNSVFTERDLINIQSVGGSQTSSKRHDGTKVGRFGLGFNSAYHIADVIAFVSVRSMVVLDPSKSFLPMNDAGTSGGGLRWDFVSESARLEALLSKNSNGGASSCDQLTIKDWYFLCLLQLFEEESANNQQHQQQGGRMHGFHRKQPYDGTLFRLPLRCQPSTLWREVHTADKILSLICGFPQMATLGLVLTKNVLRISASMSHSLQSQQPTSLFDLASTGGNATTKKIKADYLTWLGSYTSVMQDVTKLFDEGGLVAPSTIAAVQKSLPAPTQYRVSLSVTLKQSSFCQHTAAASMVDDEPSISGLVGRLAALPEQQEWEEETTHDFLVAHQFGPGHGWDGSLVWSIAEECARYHHPISVPWSATIVQDSRALLDITAAPSTSTATTTTTAAITSASSTSGKLMCFFPIRSSTGLPVHIHGYFQLSSDRQSVSTVDRSRWNAAMCSEVVPYGYAEAIRAHCTDYPVESPVKLWPLGSFSDDVTVEAIATSTLRLLGDMKVFPTRGGGATMGTATTSTQTTTFPIRYERISSGRLFVADAVIAQLQKDAQHEFRHAVTTSDITADAYHYLIQALDGGGNLLYVQHPTTEFRVIAVLSASLHRRKLPYDLVRPEMLRASLAARNDNEIPNHIAMVLFSACLKDGDLPAFQRLNNLALIPTSRGVGGLLKHQLLLSDDALLYQLGTNWPNLRDRMVLHLSDEATTDAAQTPKTTEVETAGGFVPGLEIASQTTTTVAASGALHMCCVPMLVVDATKRFLTHLRFALECIGTLDASTLPVHLGAIFNKATSSFFVCNKSTTEDGIREWELELSGISSGVSSVGSRTSSSSSSVSIISASTLRLLWTLLQRCMKPTPEYFGLPILPGLLIGDDTSSPDAVQRRFCVAASDGICIAALSDDDGDDAHNVGLQAVFDVLVALGATAIDTTICPVALLKEWRTKGPLAKKAATHPTVLDHVVILSDPRHAVEETGGGGSSGGVASVVAALHALVSLRATLVFSQSESNPLHVPISSPPNSLLRADAIRLYIAASKDSLTMSHVTFLSTLPIFRTIWGTHVPLRGGDSHDVNRTVPSLTAVVLPQQLLPIASKALQEGGPLTEGSISSLLQGRRLHHPNLPASHTQVLSTMSILERDKDDAGLLKSFSVHELSELSAMTLAAARIAPLLCAATPQGSGDDAIVAKEVADFWNRLFELLHQHQQQQTMTTSSTTNSAKDDPYFAPALALLSRCPIIPSLTCKPTTTTSEAVSGTPVLIGPPSDGTRSGGSNALWTHPFATTHIAPVDLVDGECLAPDLAELLAHLSSDNSGDGGAQRTTTTSAPSSSSTRAQVPKIGITTIIPASIRPTVLIALGVKKVVDGDELFALCAATSHLVTLSATSAAATLTLERKLAFARAVLHELDVSKELSAEQWSDLSLMPLVPTAATTNDSVADGGDVEEKPDLNRDDESASLPLCALSRACFAQVYRLCPVGQRQCIHPAMTSSAHHRGGSNPLGSAQSSSPSQPIQRPSAATSTTTTTYSYPKLSKRFDWSLPPSLKEVLRYIKTVGTATTSTSRSSIAPKNNNNANQLRDWSAVLDHVEQQLRHFLHLHPDIMDALNVRWQALTMVGMTTTTTMIAGTSTTTTTQQQQTRGGETQYGGAVMMTTSSLPLLPSTTTGIDNFIDPLVQDQSALYELLRINMERVYFPERGESFSLSQLAFDPRADGCSPFLSTIDRASASRYAALWFTLGVRQRHTFQELINVLDEIREKASASDGIIIDDTASSSVQQGSSRHVDPNSATTVQQQQQKQHLNHSPTLSDSLRSCYSKVLEYMVEVHSKEALELCQTKQLLLVPTADGRLNWGHLVNYSLVASTATSTTTTTSNNQPQAELGKSASPKAPPSREPHLLLHSNVRSDVARTLGMQHIGIQVVAQMHAKNNAKIGGFRSRGQWQSVVDAIKRVLNDYSEQQSVLMEMIQNADDAGASEVTFYIDHRKFDKTPEHLLGKEMSRCQGPSLVVTNDSLFTPSDFSALFQIGCGHKAKDQLSIGRFGVGFNAVYHVTDCPSIVSGTETVFLDPSASHLGSATPEDPGAMITHTDEPALVDMFPAQFAPYARYGVDFKKPFRGTLFRLPFRTDPWSKSLAGPWTAADMRKLFDNFIPFMPHVLLFLKNIVTVSFAEIQADGGASGGIAFISPSSGKEVRLASVSLRDHGKSSSSEELRRYRDDIASFAATQHPEKAIGEPLREQCVVDAIVRRENAMGVEPCTTHTWLLSTVIRSMGSAPDVACNPDLKRKLLPWGSTAVLLTHPPNVEVPAFSLLSPTQQDQQRDRLGKARLLCMSRAPQSMVHCYLPLPSRKGELPYHIHGCFALTSDRRGMWTRGLTDEVSWEVKWNSYILSEIIAEAAILAVSSHPLLFRSNRAASDGVVEPAVLAAYYRLFPVACMAENDTSGMNNYSNNNSSGGGGGHQTDVFYGLQKGFFDLAYRTSAKLLWCTKGYFIEPQVACCAPTPLVGFTHSESSGGGGGRAGGSTIASSSLPFQLSDLLAEAVLGHSELLCRVPKSLFDAMVQSAEERGDATPSELSPQKIAKELYARAGSSQSLTVAYSSLVDAASLAGVTTSTTQPRPTSSANPSLRKCASPYEVMAELTLYLTQLNDISLLMGVPLVLLSDGTVGIVGKVITDGALLPLPLPQAAGAATNQATTTAVATSSSSASSNGIRSMFILPEYRKEVQRLFPDVPVVDEMYHASVTQQAHKKVITTRGPTNTTNSSSSSHHILAEPFSNERWTTLLCVEPLQLKTISKLFHLHACHQAQADLALGCAFFLDSRFSTSDNPLRRWCRSFWAFVSKCDGTVVLDAAFLQQCGQLSEWPLVPARRSGEQVLLPLKEISLLVCGNVQNQLVSEVLDHLGVWMLDMSFEEAQVIRGKCNVASIEGEKIGEILENALAQGRFEHMSSSHRIRMLEWLMQTNQSNRGIFSRVFGRAGSMTTNIRKLPLFEVYDSVTRSWTFAPLDRPDPQQLPPGLAAAAPRPAPSTTTTTTPAIAVPSNIPITPLCHGMYRKPQEELGLPQMTLTDFLLNRVHTAVQRVERDWISANREEIPSLPTPDVLTVEEELSYWRLLGSNLDDGLRARFAAAAFVPRERSFKDVAFARENRRLSANLAWKTAQLQAEDAAAAGNNSNNQHMVDAANRSGAAALPGQKALNRVGPEPHWTKLKQFAIEWVADALRHDAISNKSSDFANHLHRTLSKQHAHLLASIATARLDELDRSSRVEPTNVMRPTLCPQAPHPDIIARLMQISQEEFTKIVCPSAIWADEAIAHLLLRLGVANEVSGASLKEAAFALSHIILLSSNTKTTPARSAHATAWRRQQLHSLLHTTSMHSNLIDVGGRIQSVCWSLALCVLNLGSSDAISSVRGILFVAPHPLPHLPKKKPDGMIPAAAARVQEESNSRCLACPQEMAAYDYRYCVWLEVPILPLALTALNPTKPPLSAILTQLTALLSVAPPAALSRDVTDTALSSIYSVLASEYRREILEVETVNVFRHQTLFAVPLATGQLREVHETEMEGNAHVSLECTRGDRTTKVVTPIRVFPYDRVDDDRERANSDSSNAATASNNKPSGMWWDDEDACNELLLESSTTTTTRSQPRHPLEDTMHSLGGGVLSARLPQIIQVSHYRGGAGSAAAATPATSMNVSSSSIGSLRPHFYHVHEFEHFAPLASLIHIVSPKSIGAPKVDAVLAALNTYRDFVVFNSQQQLQTYVELLKLLVYSAEQHHVLLQPTAPPAATTANKSKPITSSTMGDTSFAEGFNSSDSIVYTDQILIPDERGELLLIEDGISIPDQPSLLRRIVPGSIALVHPLIPQPVARALGVPSVGRVLLEEPRTDRGDDLSTSHNNTRIGDTTAFMIAQYRMFFRSPLFPRVVLRLLLTASHMQHATSGGGNSLGSALPRGGASSGRQTSLSASTRAELSALDIKFVDSISLFIAHEKNPRKNIASGTESPPFALSRETSTIYIVDPLRCGSQRPSSPVRSKLQQQHRATRSGAQHYYLVAMAINRMLHNRLNIVLAPLCSVLEFVSTTTSATPMLSLLPYPGHSDCGGVISMPNEAPNTRRAEDVDDESSAVDDYPTTTTMSSIPSIIHDILDTFDCADVTHRTSAATHHTTAQPLGFTTTKGTQNHSSGHSSPLLELERRLGRLVNVPSSRMHDVADNAIVDDIWLLKYAVSDVDMLCGGSDLATTDRNASASGRANRPTTSTKQGVPATTVNEMVPALTASAAATMAATRFVMEQRPFAVDVGGLYQWRVVDGSGAVPNSDDLCCWAKVC